jgi:hypothetical protein
MFHKPKRLSAESRFSRLTIETLEPRCMLDGTPIISEFMAANSGGLKDEDGASSDWIEIFNPTTEAVNLEGWHLTDDSTQPTKWTFPSITIDAGAYQLVYASGKNRVVPTSPLHTNFMLAKEGEYLALVEPVGLTAVSVFAPSYPEQRENISYGAVQNVENILTEGSGLKFHVPTAEENLGSTWTTTGFNDASWQGTSPMVITEANSSSDDWVEIQNVSSAAVNTSGWVVAVNNATSANINTVTSTYWSLPSSVNSSEVLYRTSNSGDTSHYWGTNLSLNSRGWVMMLTDAGQVADFVVWGYTAAQLATLSVTVNGYNIQSNTWTAWSGAPVNSNGNEVISLQRSGSIDSNSAPDWKIATPTQGTVNQNLSTPFDFTPTSGIGYISTASDFQSTRYQAISSVTINNITDAEAVIADPAKYSATYQVLATTINYYDTGAAAHFGNDQPFPGTTIGVDVDKFVMLATGKVIIPTAGEWTFGVNSDDGFKVDITGGGNTYSFSYPGTRGAGDTFATFNIPIAGNYDVRLVMFESSGGSSLEFFAAQGSHTTFNSQFYLVGDTNGGLAMTGFGSAKQSDIGKQMENVNTSVWTRFPFTVTNPSQYVSLNLRVKYNDGFVAYLNGQEIARRNAPTGAISWNSQALGVISSPYSWVEEDINLFAYINLLQTGTNVLAIQGLNATAGVTDYFLLPELTAVSQYAVPALRYFEAATPNEPNTGTSYVGFVADTKFSVDRGFYSQSFQTNITTATAGAAIYYTLDGSEPSPTNGTLYSTPLTISQTTVLRAAAFKTDHQPSNIDTETYIFTDDVILQSSNGQPPAGWPTGPINGQVINYGMDPDIVNDPTWGPQIEAALESIPTFSFVTDLDNLFDPTTGIYVNATNDGSDWERPVSVELIYPDGTVGFQIDAGLRIRGRYSREDFNPKHAFRLLFDNEYGESELVYPFFGTEGTDTFKNLDLRCSQNYAWASRPEGEAIKEAQVRDLVCRDLQGLSGDAHTRGNPYHLYINGEYWGLYETEERGEASFAATYFGGESEDYDVIKVDGSSFSVYATDGTIDAWQTLWNLANAGLSTNQAYYRVLGRNPDGTRNPAYPVLVDEQNLIDYMINIFYTGNMDSPVSNFLGNAQPNNVIAIYNRNGQEGFKFLVHDNEHTFQPANDLVGGDANRTLNFTAGDTFEKSNPQWIHQQLMAHPEYRQKFADRVQQLFFNGGIYTPEAVAALYTQRANDVNLAIIAESARWGDAQRATPYTKTNWQNAVNTDLNWIATRTAIVLNQLKSTKLRDNTPAPLFPSVAAPGFSQRGGAVYDGYLVTLNAPAGDIYYTFDGSDPRLPGGGISPSAQLYQATTTPTTLIPQGATWKYLDNGTDQGTAWRAEGFNDSTWESGPAQLGYGDGDEATTVGYIDTNPSQTGEQKNATTYFRATFNVTDPAQITGLTLELLRDDGAVVYINGQADDRVLSNMPTGTINYQTWAYSTVSGSGETTFYIYTLDPSILHAGQNTIAVEIHQDKASSSDISFDLKLIATSTVTAEPITIHDTTLIKTRAISGGVWSALDEAQFIVDAPASIDNLAVSEINYNPANPTAAELLINPAWSAKEFEYIELKNISGDQIDLTNARFTLGITFDFTDSNVTKLTPGDYVLVVSNLDAFQARYGTSKLARVAGTYSGSLSNSGELVTLVDHLDVNIFSFTYGTSGAWPGRADGKGSALELINPDAVPKTAAERTAYLQDPTNWRSTSEYNGSPAANGTGAIQSIVVNEVLTHTDPPMYDSIELYNPTDAEIDISGWYLSDSSLNYQKFAIPEGTILGSHQYVIFTDEEFGTYFSLDAVYGDEVWLLETDDAGNLTSFIDKVEFGATANGESLGRWPNGTGDLYPLINRTLGEPSDIAGNGPRIGPVLISEVMYNPSVNVGEDPDDFEYIEIFNPTNSGISLANWRLRKAVDFDFPADTVIDAKGTVVVLPFNPDDALNATKLANFNAKYNIGSAVKLVGGFQGKLDNDSETVQLQDPDDVVPDTIPPYYPGMLEDEVKYENTSPWPLEANGSGSSLQRLTINSWGNAAGSWIAAAPSPGSAMMVASAVDWTAAGMTLKINTTDGLLHLYGSGTTNDVVAPQNPVNITSINIAGRNNLSDILTVDYSNGNPIPVGGLYFNGGIIGTSGSNSLCIAGSSADENAILSTTQITGLSVGAINYSNTTYFSFQLGGGGNNLTIDNATLKINQNNAISAETSVIINNGVLDLNGNTDTVKDLVLHSGSIVNGVLNANSYNIESGTVIATLAGPGNLQKTTTGQATAGIVNTPNVTVNAGQLTATSIHTGTLTIGAGSKVTIAPIVSGIVSGLLTDLSLQNTPIKTPTEDNSVTENSAQPLDGTTIAQVAATNTNSTSTATSAMAENIANVYDAVIALPEVNVVEAASIQPMVEVIPARHGTKAVHTVLPQKSLDLRLDSKALYTILESRLDNPLVEMGINNGKTSFLTLLNNELAPGTGILKAHACAPVITGQKTHITALDAIVQNLHWDNANDEKDFDIARRDRAMNYTNQIKNAVDAILSTEKDLFQDTPYH